jgi:hypothetical protein
VGKGQALKAGAVSRFVPVATGTNLISSSPMQIASAMRNLVWVKRFGVTIRGKAPRRTGRKADGAGGTRYFVVQPLYWPTLPRVTKFKL